MSGFAIPPRALHSIEEEEKRRAQAREDGRAAARARRDAPTETPPEEGDPSGEPRPSAPVAHARRNDPSTSRKAAASVTGIRLSQAAVLKLFKDSGAMTDIELVDRYPLFRKVTGITAPRQSESGLRTRRKELVDLGRLEDSGVKKRLPSGRMAIVWRCA